MNGIGFFEPLGSAGRGGASTRVRYSISQITDQETEEISYQLMQTLGNNSPEPVGSIISFRGNQILVNYDDQLVLLDTAITDIEQQLNKTYNFTTFEELNINTSNKTLIQITNELIAKGLPTNTIVTGQLYSAALPFSGNGEAEVLVNHPAFWWTCKSLTTAPYSWTALTADQSWGGVIYDWIPSNYELPIASDSTLGGIIVGDNISVDANGVISVASPYTLPAASVNDLGGVKVGSGLVIEDGVLSIDEGTPEETVTYDGVPPLAFESNGKPASEYSIIGDMEQSGTPSKSTPIYPQEFGDLVESGEHAGEYAITFTVGGNTNTIYLDQPLRKFGEYVDTINSDGTVSRRIFKFVLKGTENWSFTAHMQKLPYDGTGNPGYLREAALISFCSHYTAVANQTQASLQDGQMTFLVSGSGTNNLYIRDNVYEDDTAGFKSYLASQYNANTPVCIWYVTANEVTETFDAPELALTKGINTLSFETGLQPSYISVTCTIGGGGGGGTSADKVSYSNVNSGLKATNAQTAIDELAITQKRLYGTGFDRIEGELASGESLTLTSTNCKKNNTFSFMATISTVDKILGIVPTIYVGQGFETYSGSWVEITDTKLIVHNYSQSDSTVEYTHGLTISDYVYVQIFVNISKADIVIYSNGSTFKQTNVNWFGCAGDYFAKSYGNTVPMSCVFTWSSPDFRKSIWLFGDSYVGLNNVARWATQLRNAGFADNILIDGYAGRASSDAITSLTNALTHYGKPDKLVWALGMNDGADSGDVPSAKYSTGIAQVEAICAANSIELIYATIPSVPNQSNEKKNEYVRGTGKRFIDFAAAVGASANGVWYTDMLSNDNVHPTEVGAIALYHRAIADCPELTFPNP